MGSGFSSTHVPHSALSHRLPKAAIHATDLISLDITANTTGLTEVGPKNQMPYKDEQCMVNNKPLIEYGLQSSTAKGQALATVRLTFQVPGSGKFETLEVTPLSSPP